jgi:hypothetical protein
MTEEEIAEIRGIEQVDVSLYDIAAVKAYNYCEEYNIATGRVEERGGARLLKEGYIDGFLAGFAHKMGGGHGGD